MASSKEQKYLDKILGNGAPAVAQYEAEPTPIVDNRLDDLVAAINALKLGVQVSQEEDGTLYIGKATPDGNHYVIINTPEDGNGFAYAFANQETNQGEVQESDSIVEVARVFNLKTIQTEE